MLENPVLRANDLHKAYRKHAIQVPVLEAPGVTRIGRFGWKDQHASLVSFTADAFVNEMGMTSPLFPNENCPQGDCAALAFNPALSRLLHDGRATTIEQAILAHQGQEMPRAIVSPHWDRS